MAFQAIARLEPELSTADAAILVGDLTNFGDPPDAFRVIEAARALCPHVLAVTGNLDMPWVIDALRAEGISLHGEGRRLGDLGVFGCGGSNITPMDTPTEFDEDELRAVLERGHAAVADAPRRLMICHTPPFDTRLDRLVNGRPVGSPAVRAFIEARRPELAVVGHIHEGRGADRVGETLVLNAGALRDGGYVVVEDGAGGLTAELRHFRARARRGGGPHHRSMDVEEGRLGAYTAALERDGLRIVDRGDYGNGDETAFISPRSAPGILVQFWQVPGFHGAPPEDHPTDPVATRDGVRFRVDHLALAVRSIDATPAWFRRIFPVEAAGPKQLGWDGAYTFQSFRLAGHKLELT